MVTKLNCLHLIYEKGRKREVFLKKNLLNEEGHSIQSKSKSNHLLTFIPTKLSNSSFSKIIVYINLDDFSFLTLHNLIMKMADFENVSEIICLGGKKSVSLFEKLNKKNNRNLLFLLDPLNVSVYKSLLFKILEEHNFKKTSSISKIKKENKKSEFSRQLPVISAGVNSMVYDVRNMINSIKVFSDHILSSSLSQNSKGLVMQKGIYCYCDDFLSFVTDIMELPEKVEAPRKSDISIKAVFDYILDKYSNIFKVFNVLISCEYQEENLKIKLDNYWLKRVLSYMVISCKRDLISKGVENPKMKLSFKLKNDLYIFELKTNNDMFSDYEIKELFSVFQFDEGKDRSGLGLLMMNELLKIQNSKVEAVNEESGLILRIIIPY